MECKNEALSRQSITAIAEVYGLGTHVLQNRLPVVPAAFPAILRGARQALHPNSLRVRTNTADIQAKRAGDAQPRAVRRQHVRCQPLRSGQAQPVAQTKPKFPG